MNSNILPHLVLSLLLLTFGVQTAKAVTPTDAITSLNYINPYSDGSYSLGWSFTVNQGVTVTSLGFFDYNAWLSLGGTLNGSHEVGIFDSQGVLLTSATVQVTDPLSDLFNWVTVAPTALYKDQTYYIEAVTGSDLYTYSSVITTAPWMTFLTNNYNSTIPTTQLLFPDSTVGTAYDAAFIGPNFAGIPEPASITLLGVGLVGLGLRFRKRLPA